MGTVERYHGDRQGAEGDHQGDGPRADAADVGQEEEGEEGDEEAGEEEGEEAEEEKEEEEGPAVRLVQHVQDAGDAVEAHQVSARSRARSIAKPCSTLTQHMYRTAAAWRNLMTCRRCRVYWSMPFSARGRETSSPTCGRIWRSLVEG